MSSEATGHSSPLGPKEPRLVSALVDFEEGLAPVLWILMMRTVSVVGAATLSVVKLSKVKIGYMFQGFVQLKLTIYASRFYITAFIVITTQGSSWLYSFC